jgi:monoamine oxidase
VLSRSAYRLANSFFQLIHPGEIKDYLPQRRTDAFIKYVSSHYETGNGFLTQKLAEGCSLKKNAEAISIEEKNGLVEVVFISGGKKQRMFGRAAICATPAARALKIIRRPSETCRRFLSSLRHGGGDVVAAAFKTAESPCFSYVSTPEMPTTTIVRQKGGDSVIFLSYYMGKKAQRISSLKPAQVTREAVINLRSAGFIGKKAKPIFTDHRRWALISHVIGQSSYATFDASSIRPSNRIFLAGDYAHVEPNSIMPYGMKAAAMSGRSAANAVRALLSK